MKISLSWLRDLVPYQGSVEELSDILTNLGLSVESVERVGAVYTGVVVGKVISAEKVTGSDHLTFCTVEAGVDELLPIVCGAPNVAAGQTVPVALVGAKLPGDFVITERKLRGVVSRGMICSQRELGLSEDHSGIMVLPEDWQIGRPVEEYLGAGDVVFDLEVTFNRPDCLSHLGVAREISAKLGLPLTMPEATPLESDEPASKWVSVEILDADKCPRYTARVVTGVKVAPSPKWMQDRLKAVGIRPISNVVDVTNYVMMELGHPLHAFDYHLVEDGKIIVRRAQTGERFITLDAKEQTLSEGDLLIADPEKGVALAGVMGGLNSEINDSTQDVLIECAVFDPVGIRITSRDRGFGSESSRRFERGVDPEMTLFAATRAAFLIQQLAGGSVLQGAVDAYPKPKVNRTVHLRSARANALLATDLTPGQMSGYLESLGCKVVKSEKSSTDFEVIAPSWRGDLEREIDLIEEIIRLHGYNEVGLATRSSVPLDIDPDRERERKVTHELKQIMVELGVREAVTWSLIPSADADHFPDGKIPVRVINPLSEDLSVLRTNPAQTLLRAVERNLNSGAANVRLFEWGKCFWMAGENVKEELRLGVILTGTTGIESWLDKPRDLEIYDAKGLAEGIASRLRLDNYRSMYYDIPDFLNYGCALAAGSQDSVLGHFGQIDPVVAAYFGIERPVWYIELDGSRIISEAGRAIEFRQLNRFPVARRDLAFILDNAVKAATLQDILTKSGGDIIEQIELFDLYMGKGIPEGRKSIAFHLTFRSRERTLADAEVDSLVEAMIQAAKETGAELRAV